MGKIAKFWSFIKTLKIEPYLFLHMFAGSVASVTSGLLLQDKICVNIFNQSNDFCTNFSQIKSSDDPQDYKDLILSSSTQYGLYRTILGTVPAIFWSLFIGAFTDRYINGRKIVLCLSSIGGIVSSLLEILNAYYFKWSPYYLLLNSIPGALTGGGMMSTLMAVYSYVSVHTPENLRSIRYAIIEFSFFLGGPLGTYVGGLILKDTPNNSGGQLHNYMTVIGVSAVTQIVAFFLLLILINEKNTKEDDLSLVDNEANDHSINDINKNEISDKNENSIYDSESGPSLSVEIKSDESEKWYYFLKLLFDTENVRDVWICCVKKRENHGRRQIWLLFLSMCIMLLSMIGIGNIQFQFSEKVYYWSATFYSNVHSVSSIVNSVFMTIAIPILVVKLKLLDTELAIVGIVSSFLGKIIVGSYQHPLGYYASVVVGLLT